MSSPELVGDMVRTAKERCGKGFSISVTKLGFTMLYICHRETIKWVKAVESVGIEYITIHGRRRTQRSTEPVNVEAIKLIKSSVTVPVVLNGDAFSIDDATRMIEATGVDGVMAARGLLPIPALFANYRKTPWGAVERFLDYNMRSPLAISTDIAPCIGDDGGYDI